jgi:hypothetical protein
MKGYFFTFLMVIFVLYACNDSHEYKIDPQFSVYLQRFETEGASRGHVFNPQISGLIMEFGNLSDNNAGLTHYETPVRIQIDKTYWNDVSKSSGADVMKEDLIFHELGHALLGRDHLNTTLENGDWKSMMCGGNKVNNRPWNINYRGVRRNYYIDELFNQNTPSPDFASSVFKADTTGFSALYQFNFDSQTQFGWPLGDDSVHSISFDDKRLKFQSKVNQVYLVFANLSTAININSDFSYELTFFYPVGDITNQYGLIFGPRVTGTTESNESMEYFTINNDQKMDMGNSSWYSFYTELNESQIVRTGINKLKVFKIGTMIYYFINNVYSYCSEIEAAADLKSFGFRVPPLGTIWIDNFSISVKGNTTSSQKVKQLQPEFGYKTVDKFNSGIIRNK